MAFKAGQRHITKSLLTLVLLLMATFFAFVPPPVSAAVSAPSDQTTGASGGTSNAPTCAYGSSPAKNALLVVAFLVGPSTITVGAPTDTLGNSFSQVKALAGGSTVTFEIYMYAAREKAASGADTITLSLTGTVVDSYLTCFEVIGASNIVSTSTSNSGTSLTGTAWDMTTSSLTPTANDLVYAFAGYQTCGASSSPTYTTFTSMTAHGTDFTGGTTCHTSGSVPYHNNAQDEYDIPSTTGALTAAMTITEASTQTTGTWGWAEIAADFEVDPVVNPSLALSPTFNPSPGITNKNAWSLASALNPKINNGVASTLSLVPSINTALVIANSISLSLTSKLFIAPLLEQEKTCTFTASSSPTCTFNSSTSAGHEVYVEALDTISADTISSVTDSQSNSYSQIVISNINAVGDVEGWCSKIATGGTLTVTVNYGASLSGIIFINDVNHANGCGVDASTGTGVSTSSPTVTPYTPISNTVLIIGAVNAGCAACTVSAGAGYMLDNTGAIGIVGQGGSEHIENAGTAESTPFSLSTPSAYNEISAGFEPAGDFATELDSALALLASIGQALGIITSPSMSLMASEAVVTNFYTTFMAVMTLGATLNENLNNTISAVLSLSSTLNQSLGVVEYETMNLMASLSTMFGTSATLNTVMSLGSTLSQELGLTNTSILSLNPALNQALSLTEFTTMSLVATLMGTLTGFVEAFNAMISLNPIINQALGVTEASTMSLLATVTGAIGSFLATLSAAISLSPSIDQDLSGITNAASLSLASIINQALTVGNIGAPIFQLFASMSLSPTLNQALDIAQSVQLALSSTLNQALGINEMSTISLAPSLITSLMQTYLLSVAMSLSPALNEALTSIAQAFISLTSSLTALKQGFIERFSAVISLSPTIGQSLMNQITSALSITPLIQTLVLNFSENLRAIISLGATISEAFNGGGGGGAGLLDNTPPLFGIFGLFAMVFLILIVVGSFRKKREENYTREPYA